MIAIPGSVGYMVAGLGRTDLPPFSIGFVSLAAFALTIPASLLTTRAGVGFAHRLSRRSLEIAFGTFLMLVAIRFLWELVSPGRG